MIRRLPLWTRTAVFGSLRQRSVRCRKRGAFSIPPDRFNSIHRLLEEHIDPAAEDLVVGTSWGNPYSIRELTWLVRGHMSNVSGLGWLVGTHNRAVRAAGSSIEHLSGSDLIQNRQGSWRVKRESHFHHLTHAATAAFTSPFREAACAIVDGAGQGTSASFYAYESPAALRRIKAPGSVSSLGLFYSLVCEWCGFDSFQGEEWKVMGLAAFGEVDDGVARKMRRLIGVRGLQVVYPAGRSEFRRLVAEFTAGKRRAGEDPLGYANLARTGQEIFSEILVQLLRNLYSAHPTADLVVGGGCFLNSAFNGLIVERTPFERVHCFAAPADDGNALGAALLSAVASGSELGGLERPLSPYLGSKPNDASLRRIVAEGAVRFSEPLADVPKQVAALLGSGAIVGWMRGSAEFGPRALGARSILADPRSADIADKINERVKFRESFRPLAPSILEGYEADYFVAPQSSPYMERALQFSPRGSEVPGVVHADGTGRLHSVNRCWNPIFFETIDQFRRTTGVPMVINTSLNVMGKPIVHSVEDAMAVFLGSGLDAIVIENQLFTKHPSTLDVALGALS